MDAIQLRTIGLINSDNIGELGRLMANDPSGSFFVAAQTLACILYPDVVIPFGDELLDKIVRKRGGYMLGQIGIRNSLPAILQIFGDVGVAINQLILNPEFGNQSVRAGLAIDFGVPIITEPTDILQQDENSPLALLFHIDTDLRQGPIDSPFQLVAFDHSDAAYILTLGLMRNGWEIAAAFEVAKQVEGS